MCGCLCLRRWKLQPEHESFPMLAEKMQIPSFEEKQIRQNCKIHLCIMFTVCTAQKSNLGSAIFLRVLLQVSKTTLNRDGHI